MTTGVDMDFVLYLRKSVGRKAVPRQRALTNAYVTQLGGRIIAEFADADRTAFRKPDGDQPKRDGFTAMLDMLRANRRLALAAWHADRLTRNDEDTAQLIRVCAAGDHLVVTQSGGSYDLSTANGRKRLRDDASAAIYEVDHNRERVLAARAEVASDGRWLGGKRPFGWEPDPDPVDGDGKPMLDEDGRPVKGMLRLREAEAVALMAAHYDLLGGMPLGAIARDWNAKGILTSAGKPWRAREVGRVLRRPRNAGLMEHCGQITGPAKWPAIVAEKTWRAVAAMLADPARRTTPGPERRHLLTWLATCGVCGSPVFCTTTSNAASSGGTRRKTYRCREDTRGHVARDAATLDDFITRLVIERLSRPDAARLLVSRGSKPDIAALQTEAAAIRDLMKARDRLHRQRVIDDQMLTEGLAELRAELAEVEQKIADAGQADVLAPLIGNPAEVWDRLSLGQRRAIIDTLMTVTVLPSPKGRPRGWQPGQRYFRADSISISWKR
jgi:site-specific DNA recombinase